MQFWKSVFDRTFPYMVRQTAATRYRIRGNQRKRGRRSFAGFEREINTAPGQLRQLHNYSVCQSSVSSLLPSAFLAGERHRERAPGRPDGRKSSGRISPCFFAVSGRGRRSKTKNLRRDFAKSEPVPHGNLTGRFYSQQSGVVCALLLRSSKIRNLGFLTVDFVFSFGTISSGLKV